MVEIPGKPIDLKEYDGLSGRSPVPFHIKLVPRHENVAKVLGLSNPLRLFVSLYFIALNV
ncbi:uncharacterized protein FIBRA_08669 [Fibroporia radiculosa]|uniref:Uncharacterized protein n=1 Tax=Fibroporia radiculosa TaxID=599839 RepID=J4GI09_9APHY|nr:uncharacterized protein FIBRA_08669 [Fibroporia radiculosa]CCM06408.1 predicted protein [Fibroporia radiculosa]